MDEDRHFKAYKLSLDIKNLLNDSSLNTGEKITLLHYILLEYCYFSECSLELAQKIICDKGTIKKYYDETGPALEKLRKEVHGK